jgi:hypothetical protein
LSVVHFAAVGFCHAIPTLLIPPGDMGATPLGEVLDKVGDVLRVPFDWVWEERLSHHTHPAVGYLLLMLTSCFWGFGLVLASWSLFRLTRKKQPKG